MKKYRVQYRQSDRQNDLNERAEEVYADGWRVDVASDNVVLFKHVADYDSPVFDVPRSRVTRIQEIGAG
jgi:hypothetical protein